MTETWFKHENYLNLSGYNAYHTYRTLGRSGGVSLYIKFHIVSNAISELCTSNKSIEISTALINLNAFQIIIYAINISHSGTIENFTSALTDFFYNSHVSRKFSLILGDLNIKILDSCNPNKIISFKQCIPIIIILWLSNPPYLSLRFITHLFLIIFGTIELVTRKEAWFFLILLTIALY